MAVTMTKFGDLISKHRCIVPLDTAMNYTTST